MSQREEDYESDTTWVGARDESWWEDRLKTADNESEELAIQAARLMLDIENKRGVGKIKLYNLNIVKLIQKREQGIRISPKNYFSEFYISVMQTGNRLTFKLNRIDRIHMKERMEEFTHDESIDSFGDFAEKVISNLEEEICSHGWTMVEHS